MTVFVISVIVWPEATTQFLTPFYSDKEKANNKVEEYENDEKYFGSPYAYSVEEIEVI